MMGLRRKARLLAPRGSAPRRLADDSPVNECPALVIIERQQRERERERDRYRDRSRIGGSADLARSARF